MQKIIITIIILLSSLMLTGCMDQKVYEDVGLIMQAGIEEDTKGLTKVTFTAPVIGTDKLSVIKVRTTDPKLAINVANTKSDSSLEFGKIQQVMFSKEMAKNGIEDIVDIGQRDSTNQFLAKYIIVDGSPETLIETSNQFEDTSLGLKYIEKLLQNGAKSGLIQTTNIFKFNIDVSNTTKDPTLPIIKLNKNEIILTGTALFKGDRLIGDITTEENLYLSILNNDLAYSHMLIPYHGENTEKDSTLINLFIKKAKTKTKIDIVDNQIVINFDITLISQIDELNWQIVHDRTSEDDFENITRKYVTDSTIKLVEKLKKMSVDPIGIKEHLRAYHNDFYSSSDLNQKLKNAKINIKVSVDTSNYSFAK